MTVGKRAGLRGQPLALDAPGVADLPGHVWAQHVVAAAVARIAPRGEHTAELHAAAVEPSARRQRARSRLIGVVGRIGARQKHKAAAAVVHRQRAAGEVDIAPGAAQAPARLREAACVEGFGGRAQQVGRLEEEGPLLGEEQGEARVAGKLRHIERELREVGVERGVDDELGARPPLHIQARVHLAVAHARRTDFIAACLAHGDARPHGDEVAALGQGHTDEWLQVVDEARHLAADGHRSDEVELLARQAARDHEAPRALRALLCAIRIAQ